ncbi:MAG: ATP-binding cassette domain-containing protein, partial [Acidimicrobiia bacterium]
MTQPETVEATPEPSTQQPQPDEATEVVFQLRDVSVRYGDVAAIEGVTFDIGARRITAIIGPSGCGKSTFLRCLNRMNDLIVGARVSGTLTYHGVDLYGPKVDAVEVR